MKRTTIEVISASRRCCSALVLLLTGCNALLDIEGAHVDPRLEQGMNDAATVADDDTATEQTPSTDHLDASVDDSTPAIGDAAGPFAPSDASVASESPSATVVEAGNATVATDKPSQPSAPDAATTETSDHTHTEATATAAPDVDASAAADAAAADASVGGPSVCEKYCDDITELCIGEDEQYRDRAQCLTVCALLPEGTVGSEDNENSAACRLRYSAKARYAAGTELAAYCRQAGPGGDGRCGSNCEGFCSLMMGVCTEDEAQIYHFEDFEDCVSTCGGLPQNPVGYSTSNPNISDSNDVQCRLFHVTSAAMLDAEEHCEHAMGLTLCEGATEE